MAISIRLYMIKKNLAVHLVVKKKKKYFSPLDGTKSCAVGLLRDRNMCHHNPEKINW